VPEREVLAGRDPCEIAYVWQIDERLAKRIVRAADLFLMMQRSPVWVISGYRTFREQKALGRMGRPTAPVGVSTHTTCPATGADISLGTLPSMERKKLWGSLVQLEGLRWGGGSSLDDNGIPSDWQHIDLGPRNQ
jgi:uncharacterized protein YcbK (DUF882 family)